MAGLLYNLTKVDFFWINRDQRSFEWFLHLLTQLEVEQAQRRLGPEDDSDGRFLDMHMYITSALQKTDMRAVTLNLALDLLYQKVCHSLHFLVPTSSIRIHSVSYVRLRPNLGQFRDFG